MPLPKLNFGIVLLLLAAGGCVQPWRVIRHARANPFAPGDRFAIGKVTFADLQVGKVREGRYLDRKKIEAQYAWEDDKAAMAYEIVSSMRAKSRRPINIPPRDADFVLEVNVDWIEPGLNLGPLGSRPAEAIARLWIEDHEGRLVDEIEVRRQAGAGMTISSRLRGLGRRLGAAFGQYLRERLSAEPASKSGPKPAIESAPKTPDGHRVPQTEDEEAIEI